MPFGTENNNPGHRNDAAHQIFEKNPSNVSVITPMTFGKIGDINHTEMVLHSLLEKAGAGTVFGNTLYLAVPADLSEIEKRAYYTIGNSSRKNKDIYGRKDHRRCGSAGNTHQQDKRLHGGKYRGRRAVILSLKRAEWF